MISTYPMLAAFLCLANVGHGRVGLLSQVNFWESSPKLDINPKKTDVYRCTFMSSKEKKEKKKEQ